MGHNNAQSFREKFPARARLSLELLRDAMSYARQTGCSQWEFAIELDQIKTPGVSNSDLRWLAQMGWVKPAEETTTNGDRHRRFESTDNLAFTRRTCFVLTEAGWALCKTMNGSTWPPGSTSAKPLATSLTQSQIKPVWDRDRRELRFAGQLIKHFRWKAVNQERVLTAFQEDGWPDCIDDPLIPSLNVNPKRRLHDTIKCLNRNQAHRLIRFHGNGNGEGVIWRELERSPLYRQPT